MDATRARRTRDRARQGWYARYRQWRFARYLGFADGAEAVIAALTACRPSPTIPAALGPFQGPASVDRQATNPASAHHARSLAFAAR